MPRRPAPSGAGGPTKENIMKMHVCAGLLASLVPLAGLAQSAGMPPPGRLLASNCFQCHGTDGHAVSGFKSLAGMSPSKFAKEMREITSKKDKEGIMKIHALAYTDAQLLEIGHYFASQPKGAGR